MFFGISAMERAGTGFTERANSPSNWAARRPSLTRQDRTVSTAELFRSAASAGSATVARDTRPVGTYVLNLLPFASIPQALTHISLNVAGWDELEAKVPLDDAAPSCSKAGRVISGASCRRRF